jgi:hypothetical protein
MTDPKPCVALRAIALSLAIAFLGFSMLQAGGFGCSRPSEPIAKEQTPQPPVATSAPPASPAPAPSDNSEFGRPLATEKPAAATKPTGSEPPRYFPGTKAAPMPWAQQPQPPPPQQKNPAPNQAAGK